MNFNTRVRRLEFTYEDVKLMSDLQLMSCSSKCDGAQKLFVDHELNKRKKLAKRSHLKLVK